MPALRIVHQEGHEVDLGPHVFPTRKYGLVRRALIAGGRVAPDQFVSVPPATWEQLALVHTPDWLDRVRHCSLSLAEVARLELPATPASVEGFRQMCGWTIEAARLALDAGIAVTLGGGLHHAYAGHGEGFCMFNDVAVAIRVLQQEHRIARAAVVDLDVHHGNGTAAIFAGDPSVFTFSMHQWNNYPSDKPPSSLDVHLPDGVDDASYLVELRRALPNVVAAQPDLVFLLAGADPYEEDQLGGLSLTRAGIRERDRLVFAQLRAARLPIVVTLAGGYARHTEDTVAIHVATIEEAVAALAAEAGPEPQGGALGEKYR
jgi:acetoin utilization deacetylase AcuC-like enzyme